MIASERRSICGARDESVLYWNMVFREIGNDLMRLREKVTVNEVSRNNKRKRGFRRRWIKSIYWSLRMTGRFRMGFVFT
jgi:hypothetical protein